MGLYDSKGAALSLKTGRSIDTLVIHCAATKPSMDIGVKEIRKWHVDGNGWRDIGYHYVIRRNGLLEYGRPLDVIGAHVAGHNSGSIGVCLVGGIDNDGDAEANFTKEQWKALVSFVKTFKSDYPHGDIKGHNEFDQGKACPSFDVQQWRKAEGL